MPGAHSQGQGVVTGYMLAVDAGCAKGEFGGADIWGSRVYM
jgi:hypothetical protein